MASMVVQRTPLCFELLGVFLLESVVTITLRVWRYKVCTIVKLPMASRRFEHLPFLARDGCPPFGHGFYRFGGGKTRVNGVRHCYIYQHRCHERVHHRRLHGPDEPQNCEVTSGYKSAGGSYHAGGASVDEVMDNFCGASLPREIWVTVTSKTSC